MKNVFACLAIALACFSPAILKADVYSFNAGISGFDDENVFTHTFNLGVVDEIESVSIELTHTVAADIDFRLVSPLGTSFILSTDNGGGSDLAGEYTFVNVFSPQGGNGKWSYSGQNAVIPAGIYDAESWITTPGNPWAAGEWTLILDDDRLGDSGSVGLVTVVYSSVPEPSASVILFSIFGIVASVRRKRAQS